MSANMVTWLMLLAGVAILVTLYARKNKSES